jgi:protein disulfide-isomerase
MNYIASFIAASMLIFASYSDSVAQKSYTASMDGWEVDLNEAYKKSQKKGLPILANFTGTDWCGWCIRLKNSVFTTEAFKKWAEKNVILLEVDFPRRFKLPDNISKQNAGMQQAFQVRGYPTVWVFEMDMDAKSGKTNITALAKTGYVASPSEFISSVEANIKASRAKKPSN